MGKRVLLFSGQGSQYKGMGNDFQDDSGVFGTASEILGYDVKKMCVEGEDAELSQTAVSQPCIMACSLAAFEEFKRGGGDFQAVAGHSLGEYAAMAASGMVSYEQGFRLIKARSEAMQKAALSNGGSMYAIIGPEAEVIEKICAETEGYVIPVNYNSPVQTVIAGETEAVEQAVKQFASIKAKAKKLNVQAAFHSILMQSAADEFIKTAETIEFKNPSVSFYSNLLGGEMTEFSAMPLYLARHIISPVRFTSEITALKEAGFTEFTELGPGKILTGLVRKTIGKQGE